MRARTLFFGGIGGLIAATGALLMSLHHTRDDLRKEISARQVAQKEWAWLDAEHRRLIAVQTKPEDLELLKADRNAVTALLGEIEKMKHRADMVGSANKVSVASKRVQLSIKDGLVPALLWKNAGQDTPDAAFETALWAAAGGDLDSLAHALVFDADARGLAEQILTQLPVSVRQEIATPERLIALLTAKDVPLGSAEILTQYRAIPAKSPSAQPAPSASPPITEIVANLVDAEGKKKEIVFSLRTENGSWRLIVPPGVVEKYAVQLRAPATK